MQGVIGGESAQSQQTVSVGINIAATRQADVVVMNRDPDLLSDQRVTVDRVVGPEEPHGGPAAVPRQVV